MYKDASRWSLVFQFYVQKMMINVINCLHFLTGNDVQRCLQVEPCLPVVRSNDDDGDSSETCESNMSSAVVFMPGSTARLSLILSFLN